MILFVFEGKKREPRLYKTLERLYFPDEINNIICSFGNNIYNLYKALKEYDGYGDIVALMRERLAKRGDATLDGIRNTDISEIFLFFDYDFHNSQLPLEEINRRLEEMLTLFDDETENGKLYINYPMVESIRYTKELPDEGYADYVVSREDCRDFKRMSRDFSAYDSLDYLLLKEGDILDKDKYLYVKGNWEYLRQMNVCKANLLTTGVAAMPGVKSDICQAAIFNSQVMKFVKPCEKVAILNSFPIFIYEYFK